MTAIKLLIFLDKSPFTRIKEGRPLLSSIVILAGYNFPGEGFFKLARNLNLLHGKTDDEEVEFFAKETKKVYAYWKTH